MNLSPVIVTRLAVPTIKVLYIIADLEPGSAQHAVLDLASHLDRDQFLPHVCCLKSGGALSGKLIERGIPFFVSYSGSQWSLPGIWRLRCAIQDMGVHIVHTHLDHANFAGRIAAVWAGVPVICAHHHTSVSMQGILHRRISRRLDAHTDKIFCVSNEVRAAREAGGAPIDKLEVFYNLIEPSDYHDGTPLGSMKAELGFPADVPTVAIVGRLHPDKNHELFLQAAKRLIDEDPAIHFAIVGEGEMRRQLEHRVQELGLTGFVTFTGQRTDMARVYRALDAVVLCSKREGFGKVVLESQTAGVPVVALDVGGVSEVLARGGGYLLSEATPQAFAVAIDHAIQPENREQMRLQAMQNVAHFSATRLITQLEDIYTDLCREKHAFQHFY